MDTLLGRRCQCDKPLSARALAAEGLSGRVTLSADSALSDGPQAALSCPARSLLPTLEPPPGKLSTSRRALRSKPCIGSADRRRRQAYVESMHYSGTYPAARSTAGVFIKLPFHASGWRAAAAVNALR